MKAKKGYNAVKNVTPNGNSHEGNLFRKGPLSALLVMIAQVALWTGVAMGSESLVGERPLGAIRVGSYNIRFSGEYAAKVDGENRWELRKADLVALVKKMKLDVFGMQEVCPD